MNETKSCNFFEVTLGDKLLKDSERESIYKEVKTFLDAINITQTSNFPITTWNELGNFIRLDNYKTFARKSKLMAKDGLALTYTSKCKNISVMIYLDENKNAI